ncbi:hypothetical protein ACN8ZM_40385 (plasmid) [Burkholderia aenigmatica]|uniref:hypothetical protein n=1 Tax=Burkholderia aenigmatica TaxID=2015348 RepID=UPI003B43119E
MKVPDYPLTAETLAAMLELSRIENESMLLALRDHLVQGVPLSEAAERYGYKRQQLAVHVKAIQEKFKPAFDLYAALVQRGLAKSRRTPKPAK